MSFSHSKCLQASNGNLWKFYQHKHLLYFIIQKVQKGTWIGTYILFSFILKPIKFNQYKNMYIYHKVKRNVLFIQKMLVSGWVEKFGSYYQGERDCASTVRKSYKFSRATFLLCIYAVLSLLCSKYIRRKIVTFHGPWMSLKKVSFFQEQSPRILSEFELCYLVSPCKNTCSTWAIFFSYLSCPDSLLQPAIFSFQTRKECADTGSYHLL